MTKDEQIDQLRRERDQLAEYGRNVSKAFIWVSGGGSEMTTRIGDDFFADPDACRARVERKFESMRKGLTGQAAKLRRERDQARAVLKLLDGPVPTPCEDGAQHCCCECAQCCDCDQARMVEPDWQNAEVCLQNIAADISNGTIFSEDGPVDTVVKTGDLQTLFGLACAAAYARQITRIDALTQGGEG